MFRNPYKGRLSDWKFSNYTATSPDKRHEVWLGTAGFPFFADYSGEPMIAGMSWWDRRQLYRAFIAERKRQANIRLEAALPKAARNRQALVGK
jgi:hypothetical protein